MSWPTAADIINDAATEVGLADTADPFNSTDANVIQLCRLLKSCGRELVQARNWTYLRREYTFTTVTNQSTYSIPGDFLRMYDQTGWNRTNRLPLSGPMSPQEWQYLKARLVGVVFTVLFRPMNGQMVLYPDTNTPGGYVIAYEYGTTSWVYSDIAANVYPAWTTQVYATGSKIRYTTTDSDYWTLYSVPTSTTPSTVNPTTVNARPLVNGSNHTTADGLVWTYTGQGVEANSDAPSASTDQVWFNPLLLTRALKLAFLKAKGLDTTAAEQDYSATLNAAMGMDAPGKVLSLNHGFQDPSAMPIGAQSVPITGFGSQPLALMSKTIRRGRVAQRGTSSAVHMPAPVGGINTVTAASAMPPSDCLYLYNLIPFQYGLRTRSGYREWATGCTDAETSEGLLDYGSPLTFSVSAPLGGPLIGDWTSMNPLGVRTVLAFNGSASDGSNDRLWAVTNDGIWDVTNPTSAPTQVYTFSGMGLPTGPADAGKGVGTSFVNVAGDHYYAYCDGAYGYLLYSEKAQSWSQVTASQLYNGDPTNGFAAIDPSTFRFVMQWKSRLWFVPENSTTAWYLEVGSFYGSAYPMPFAPRFKSGGELVGLWAWTVDGGVGIDDHLVAISRGGDVVIYSGTDPSIPGAFALRGVWWVGNPPPGRRIASTFGGDLFILSVVGCVPLSKLVSGGMIRDPEILASAKVSNLFNKLMTVRGNIHGWSIAIHPTDNLMIVNVPATPSEPKQQLTMSLANMGWSQHLGVPMSCMETWHNKLFFGTEDGRVCVNDGDVDDLKIDASSLRPIEWALLTSYQNLGNPNKKMVHMVRPHFMTEGTAPGIATGARFDFDLSPMDLSPAPEDVTPSAWDTAIWDSSVWDDGSGIAGRYEGSTGLGSHVALVLRGNSVTETTFVGFDVVISQGGIL